MSSLFGRMARVGTVSVACLLGALRVTPTIQARGPSDTPVVSRAQVEADWLLQERVRHLPPESEASRRGWGGATAEQDASGGCDGIINGSFGFHTDLEDQPWWQVDLGGLHQLGEIVVYNRCDGAAQARAASLRIETSDDGENWSTIYSHDGKPFGGHPDQLPLRVKAQGRQGRFVRIALGERQHLHLDEIQIFNPNGSSNLALGMPATQSSASRWSSVKSLTSASTPQKEAVGPKHLPILKVVESGRQLAASVERLGVDTATFRKRMARIETAVKSEDDSAIQRSLFFEAKHLIRDLSLDNPLFDFDDLLFVKRAPGSFTHMSDQYYGWWSRPGGGIYVLKNFKTDNAQLRCLTAEFPVGSFLRPDLSYDGKRVLFAYCRYYPDLRNEPNKLNKDNVPEDAFYHLFEMNIDGTALRQLTFGKYDDFDGRYLPDGNIAFLSTRRGQFVQCTSDNLDVAADPARGDCYVRCGGGPERPVAVYTLHVMDSAGQRIRQISPFEMFEWTPSVDHEGRILYARWDYVDRHNMPYMSLWSTLPDGTNQQAIYGNMTRNPHCVFEARSIPGSPKIIFTASGHHAFTGGSLVMLDPRVGNDGEDPLQRLTPEVAFPESEGWPMTYFANPFPLSEEHFLVSWSASRLPPGTPPPVWAAEGPPNDLGLYLFDAFGNLNLIYRDPEISSATPIPVRARRRPPIVSGQVKSSGPQTGTVLIQNVYRGLEGVGPVDIHQLRIVGVSVKTHPTMNYPVMGMTRDDPGKFILGTVPVESDGSAYFYVPSGVPFFLQVLNENGIAVQTMRSATSVQPGQAFACIGCHEQRNSPPVDSRPLAVLREPSPIKMGPPGSWPLDFAKLVDPVLQHNCVSCHQPGEEGEGFDLTREKSYDSLVEYGSPSLRDHVMARYNEGRSQAGQGAAQTSALLKLVEKGHYDVKLSAEDRERLTSWMDTYAQRRGAFDIDQEQRLQLLKKSMQPILLD
jgi:hypothetical protein